MKTTQWFCCMLLMMIVGFAGEVNSQTNTAAIGYQISIVQSGETTVTATRASIGEIHTAAKEGDVEKVKALLREHPDLINSTSYGPHWTPLEYAAAGGHTEVVALLLANKANVDAKDVHGWTPLDMAANRGKTKAVVELLIANHADVNSVDHLNFTPLHHAVFGGQAEIVEVLLANQANVDPRDDHDRTPLHHAAIQATYDIVKLLIENKADINARDRDGRTPLFYSLSQKGGSESLKTKFLMEHGAKE